MTNNEYSIMKDEDEPSEADQEYLPPHEPQELVMEGYEVVFDKKVSLMPAELVGVREKKSL